MLKKLATMVIIICMIVALFPITTKKSDAATPTKTINILFIGNSKTYYNNMPAILSNMLTKSNYKNNYKVLVKGSMSLNFHYHFIKDNEEQIKTLFNNEKIDYVILNEQTDVQLAPYGTIYDSRYDPDPEKNYTNKSIYGNLSVDALRVVKKLRSYGMITKKDTKIILNATWNYSDLQNIDETNYNFEKTKEAIQNAGYVNCEIAYSGSAIKNVYDEMQNPDGVLTSQELFVDEKHPTQLGSYIEALAIYRAMFGTNMIADYAGSVSAEKMQQSVNRYFVFENYTYRKFTYSNEKDYLKRAFNEPKLKKIPYIEDIRNFVNNSFDSSESNEII